MPAKGAAPKTPIRPPPPPPKTPPPPPPKGATPPPPGLGAAPPPSLGAAPPPGLGAAPAAAPPSMLNRFKTTAAAVAGPPDVAANAPILQMSGSPSGNASGMKYNPVEVTVKYLVTRQTGGRMRKSRRSKMRGKTRKTHKNRGRK